MTVQATPPDQQDALDRLTAAVPEIAAALPRLGDGTSGQGGGVESPQGSLKLSSPNFLSRASRMDFYKAMGAAGFVTVILAVAVILMAHNDATDHWVGPSVALLLVGLGGWVIAYATVGGFGNVEFVIGPRGEGAVAPSAVAEPSVEPKDGATDVPLDSAVTVTFATEMDPQTVTKDSFTLTSADGSALAIEPAYDQLTKTATLKPDSPLIAATLYTAALTEAIKNLDGEAQAAKTWTFTTKAA